MNEKKKKYKWKKNIWTRIKSTQLLVEAKAQRTKKKEIWEKARENLKKGQKNTKSKK